MLFHFRASTPWRPPFLSFYAYKNYNDVMRNVVCILSDNTACIIRQNTDYFRQHINLEMAELDH